MNSIRYLNSVLTVIAVLMMLGLWTRWADGTDHRPLAMIQSAHAAGIPDAGSQRRQIVDEIKRLSNQVENLSDLFRSGQARVKLDSPPRKNRSE